MKKTIKVIAVAMVALMLMITLVSCSATPASDPDDAVQALKDNGVLAAYKDAIAQPAAYAVSGVKDVKAVVTGVGKTDDGEDAIVYIIYFASSSAASDAYEKIEDEAESKEIEGLIIDKSGAMIYFGNEAGIKAAS